MRTKSVEAATRAISGTLGKNSIVIGVGSVSQCVASFGIESLLAAGVFINANATILEVFFDYL